MEFQLLPTTQTLIEIFRSLKEFVPIAYPNIKSLEVWNSSPTLIYASEKLTIWAYRESAELGVLKAWAKCEFNMVGISDSYWTVRCLRKENSGSVDDVEFLSKYRKGEEICKIYEEKFSVRVLEQSSSVLILTRRALLSLKISSQGSFDLCQRKFQGKLLNTLHQVSPTKSPEAELTVVLHEKKTLCLKLLALGPDLKPKHLIEIQGKDFIFNPSNIKKEGAIIGLNDGSLKYLYLQRLERLVVLNCAKRTIVGSFPLTQHPLPLCEARFFKLKEHIFIGGRNRNNSAFHYLYELAKQGKREEGSFVDRLKSLKFICGISGQQPVSLKNCEFLRTTNDSAAVLAKKKEEMDTIWSFNLVKQVPKRIERFLGLEDKHFLLNLLCEGVLESGFSAFLLRTSLLFLSIHEPSKLFYVYRFLDLINNLSNCSMKMRLNFDVPTLVWQHLPVTANFFTTQEGSNTSGACFPEEDIEFFEENFEDLNPALLDLKSSARVFLAFVAVKLKNLDFIGRLIDIRHGERNREDASDRLLEYLNSLFPNNSKLLIPE